MSAYRDVIDWLFRLEAAKGMDFKLERVELALSSLGDPHRAYPCIHVAGTNGKGSVAAICDSVLNVGGHRTGLYTSPHLVSFADRVRVGGKTIGEDEVLALVEEIRRRAVSRGIDLTFFEFATVLAFLHFARCGVDAAVIEVGLGGRLDATNVVDPEVAVVTTIGLDHCEWLGDSIAEIAAEKGGILKPGRPAVFGRLRPAAETVLRRIAAERDCAVFQLDREFRLDGDAASRFCGNRRNVAGLTLPLPGSHQRDNAAVALAALEAASNRLPLTDDAVRQGLAETRWPGRFEVIPAHPTVVLDGAHNLDGVEALVSEMRSYAAGRKIHLLFAVMRDKAWEPMVRRLAEIADDVVVTTVLPPRGESPEPVAALFGETRRTRTCDDPLAAFEELLATAHADDIVLVAGSLFLVGAVYARAQRLRGDLGSARPAEVSRG